MICAGFIRLGTGFNIVCGGYFTETKRVARVDSNCSIGGLMNDSLKHSRMWVYFTATRPRFLTASAGPVLVGSALGFAVTGSFSFGLFLLALLGTVLLHSGANVANDYYDHLSGNDIANTNLSPFSGGRRYIQDGILSAKATLIESLILLAAGSVCGLAIVFMTKSIFILALGLTGLLGGFFYTAEPVKLGYRTVGEPAIAFLFGILPVSGAYYLQAGRVDWYAAMPAVIVGALIFLVILINDFPDAAADAAVDKKRFVVRFGAERCVVIYRAVLAVSYIVAIAGVIVNGTMRIAAALYLLTLPLGIAAAKLANTREVSTPGRFKVNQLTIVLHLAGAAALSAGFVISGILGW